MRPSLINSDILVNKYLIVHSDLSVRANCNGEPCSLSLNSISDIRQLETVLGEIFKSTHPCESFISETIGSHISLAKDHIPQAINTLQTNESDLESPDYPELSRLQFIQCQLENSLVPQNRSGYNVLTQVLALKTHLISPTCYKYLQQMPCLTLPHVNTLLKLYSSSGLESDYFPFLKQATHSFSDSEKYVIVQMDEIHVKSDISYIGGKIYGASLRPEDPVKTVFTIMVSSLQKKWSCIVRLLPCASLSAETIFAIVVSCIQDI